MKVIISPCFTNMMYVDRFCGNVVKSGDYSLEKQRSVANDVIVDTLKHRWIKHLKPLYTNCGSSFLNYCNEQFSKSKCIVKTLSECLSAMSLFENVYAYEPLDDFDPIAVIRDEFVTKLEAGASIEQLNSLIGPELRVDSLIKDGLHYYEQTCKATNKESSKLFESATVVSTAPKDSFEVATKEKKQKNALLKYVPSMAIFCVLVLSICMITQSFVPAIIASMIGIFFFYLFSKEAFDYEIEEVKKEAKDNQMRVAFLKQQSTNGWEYIPIEYCVAGKEKLERSAPLASQLHFLSEQYLFLLFDNLVENMYSGQDYYDDIVEALLRKCGFEKIDYDEAEKFKQSLTSKDIELLKPSGKPPVLHTYNGSYEGSKINQPVMAGDIINLLSYYRWLLANRDSLTLEHLYVYTYYTLAKKGGLSDDEIIDYLDAINSSLSDIVRKEKGIK